MVTKEDYESALYAQSACNLSGIVFKFAEIMQRLCDESHKTEKGTDWRNEHAICRLFAEQIMHLTRKTSYEKAYRICREKTKNLDNSG